MRKSLYPQRITWYIIIVYVRIYTYYSTLMLYFNFFRRGDWNHWEAIIYSRFSSETRIPTYTSRITAAAIILYVPIRSHCTAAGRVPAPYLYIHAPVDRIFVSLSCFSRSPTGNGFQEARCAALMNIPTTITYLIFVTCNHVYANYKRILYV